MDRDLTERDIYVHEDSLGDLVGGHVDNSSMVGILVVVALEKRSQVQLTNKSSRTLTASAGTPSASERFAEPSESDPVLDLESGFGGTTSDIPSESESVKRIRIDERVGGSEGRRTGDEQPFIPASLRTGNDRT